MFRLYICTFKNTRDDYVKFASNQCLASTKILITNISTRTHFIGLFCTLSRLYSIHFTFFSTDLFNIWKLLAKVKTQIDSYRRTFFKLLNYNFSLLPLWTAGERRGQLNAHKMHLQTTVIILTIFKMSIFRSKLLFCEIVVILTLW